jgi:uncharacterized protein YbaP (TraB family)
MIHLRWFAAFLSIFSINAHAEPLYWLASKGDTEYMLLGSIHIGEPSMYPLPDAVLNFLDQSDALIVEADITQANAIEYPKNDKPTSEWLDDKQRLALKKLSEELQLNLNTLEQSPPWISALTIQNRIFHQLGYRSDLGVDQQLINLAQQQKIPILGLEGLQQQIDALSSIPNGGLELLTSSLEEVSKSRHDARCMIESWKAGDKINLHRFIDRSEMSQEMSVNLEIERNNNWIEKLTNEGFLPTPHGKYLIVVGALHLIGQQNLITQLQQHGFTIIESTQTKRAACTFSE